MSRSLGVGARLVTDNKADAVVSRKKGEELKGAATLATNRRDEDNYYWKPV